MLIGKIRSIDLFGHQIAQNFNKKGNVHNTFIGGFCSIFLYAFFIAYVLLKMKILMYRENDNILIS